MFVAMLACAVARGESVADPVPERLVPLTGWQIGWIDGRDVRCFDLSFRTHEWIPCVPPVFMTLPPEATRVLANDTTVAVVSSQHVDFYDERGRLKEGHRIELWKPTPASAFINGTDSTDSDVVSIDGGRMSVSSSVNRARQISERFECPEAVGRKVYHFEWGALAIVSSDKVLMRDAHVTSREPVQLTCGANAQPEFRIPAGADEVFVFRREYMGVRTGKAVSFYARDGKGGWEPAIMVPLDDEPLPMPTLMLP